MCSFQDFAQDAERKGHCGVRLVRNIIHFLLHLRRVRFVELKALGGHADHVAGRLFWMGSLRLHPMGILPYEMC